MAEARETDYYQYEWSVAERKRMTKVRLGLRLLMLCLVLTGLIAGAFGLNEVLTLPSREFFWLLSVFAVALTAWIGFLWFKLSSEFSVRLIEYKIGREGLVVAGKSYGFGEIDGEVLKEEIRRAREEKREEKQLGEEYRIRVETSEKRLVLRFADQTTRDRVLRAFEVHMALEK